jgi:HD-GYP domain-containing protein (c-di-GMP phosphodiesterase class II)
LEPGENSLADEERLTKVCEGFARIIDAKSPWTHFHSQGVTRAAVGIARILDLTKNEIVLIQRAALLHDIGKLGVSNTILDKPDRLTDEEFALVKRHPFYSQRILEQIPSFQEVAQIAGAHHERLDGNGYHQGTRGEKLSSERPYRAALPRETVLQIIGKDVPHALCATCFEALKQWPGNQSTQLNG